MDFEYKLNHILFEDTQDELRPKSAESKPKLADLLRSGISFVVVGARAVNVYTDRPRNTLDIDILTDDYEQLADWIHKEFPHLKKKITDVVIRFLSDNESVLDIMIPNDKVFRAALRDTKQIGGYKVASPEALLAMKFHGITSSHRKLRRKMQDRVDIANILACTKVDLNKTAGYLKGSIPRAEATFKAFIVKLKEDFEL